MSTETATVTETPASPKTAKAPKPVGKKTPAKAKPTAKTTGNGASLRGTRLGVLKLLAKGKPLTRGELSEKLGGAWVGPDLMGRFEKPKPGSLSSLGYVRFANDEESAGAVYEITAKGRKALEDAK